MTKLEQCKKEFYELLCELLGEYDAEREFPKEKLFANHFTINDLVVYLKVYYIGIENEHFEFELVFAENDEERVKIQKRHGLITDFVEKWELV